jgi:hypothetical protein
MAKKTGKKTAPPPGPPPREDPCAICGQPLGDPRKLVASKSDDLQVRWAHRKCAERGPLRARLKARGSFPPEYQGRPGQRLPRRFSALSWASVLPGYLQQFDGEVPGDYWTIDALDASSRLPAVATVSCPCGEEPQVSQNGTALCGGENCGRTFMLVGERIRVARYKPDAEPETTSD